MRLTINRLLKTILLLFLLFPGKAFSGSQQESNTLVSTIITNARASLNDTASAVWSDAALLSWVNNGILDIIAKSHCLENTFSISPGVATIEYDVPLSKKYITIEAAYFFDGATSYKGLEKALPVESGRTTDVEEPVYWYEWNRKVFIYPSLKTGNALATVTFEYIEQPAEVALTDYVPIPAVYDKSLTLYVVFNALLQKNKMQSGLAILKEYQEEIARYRVDLDEKL